MTCSAWVIPRCGVHRRLRAGLRRRRRPGRQGVRLSLWFYGYSNYLNTKQFKEVGLDPEKDWPQTWEQLGEVAKRLTIKDGDKFTRQGFKFAMHAAAVDDDPVQSDPDRAGGQWFDKDGKCTINNEAGIKAMTVRASIAKKYGAEDPADIDRHQSAAAAWIGSRSGARCSCAIRCRRLLIEVAESGDGEGQAIPGPSSIPAFKAGKGISTTYGFNLVINARAPKDKQEVLHDLYKFMMSDLVDCWKDTAPFTLARKSGWADDPQVKDFPYVKEIIRARDEGVSCRARWSTTRWPTPCIAASRRSC